MTALLESPTIGVARETAYRFFALMLSNPRYDQWSELQDPENRCLITSSSDLIRTESEDDPIPLGFGERPASEFDLSPILTLLTQPDLDAVAEFDRVFGLVTLRECPPYETEHCINDDPFFRAQQLADAAGFYRAFGLTQSRIRPDRADHIALQLSFMAHLLMMERLADSDERASICADAAKRFFRDHIAWWVPSFARGLRKRAEGSLYALVADALAAFLPTERSRLAVKATQSPRRPRVGFVPAEESEGCAGCSAN
jgi:TorA maturation chaperone TorD